jgi:quercetin 2,3-dioxygenase
MTPLAPVDIRLADNRFHTDLGWLDSHHSFSFGGHYDPANTHHGLLVVSNDDVVAPGRGFGAHSHHDMEIVSWVLDGELEHQDSEGNRGVIRPGLVQRMSAGRGITHAEMNARSDEPVHFLQMWVQPDETGITPGYEELDVTERLIPGVLVPVASGQGHEGTVRLRQAGAVMSVARFGIGDGIVLPDARFVHMHVAKGSVELDDTVLQAGDAVRLSDAGVVSVSGVDHGELVVWETDQPVG